MRRLSIVLMFAACGLFPDGSDGEHENPDGPCNPAAYQDGDCPQDYTCCSDDPATSRGRIPNYFQSGVDNDVYGPPIFSGANNVLSNSGQCVDVGAFTSPFPSGCAVPCNPTWEADVLAEICGISSTCCSYTQVDPNVDCVLDNGVWRAVTGTDIGTLSQWGPQHATNQDPQGKNCMIYASAGGTLNQEIYNDCLAQLSVANQRGFCIDAAACPCQEDVCGQKNAGYVLRCK